MSAATAPTPKSTRTCKRPSPDDVSDYDASADRDDAAPDSEHPYASVVAGDDVISPAPAAAAAAAPRGPGAKRGRPAAAAAAAAGAPESIDFAARAAGAGRRSSGGRQKGLTAAQLRRRLGPLSKEQLIGIACTIAGETGYDMQKVLESDAGKPDLAVMDKEIGAALRPVTASLPHSKFWNTTDAHAYLRVASNLRQFKHVLNQHLVDLFNSADWDSVADFVEGIALKYVEKVPLFDDPRHNAARSSIVAKLATVLRRASRSLAQERRDRLVAAVAESSFAAELGPALQDEGAAPRKPRSSSSAAMHAPVDELPADMEVPLDANLDSDGGGDDAGDGDDGEGDGGTE
eukprot:m51a1_g6300 hypothetical protein (347) ;mRNA; r:294353-295977